MKLSYEWFSSISTTTCSISGIVSVPAGIDGNGNDPGGRICVRPSTCSASTCQARGSFSAAAFAYHGRRRVIRRPATVVAATAPAPSTMNARRVVWFLSVCGADTSSPAGGARR
jgi:hypothetical protein